MIISSKPNVDLESERKKYLDIQTAIVTKNKIKIKYPMSIKVAERIWIKNQKISYNDDNSITFEAVTSGIEDIRSWVLGMGVNAEVLEPRKLRDLITEEIKNLKKLYK